MPSDFALKTGNALHRALVKVSRGRVGWTALGMPVLELTTKGRMSGVPRTVMLTSPLQDGDAIVVVASKGGDDDHPAWFLNLRAHPEVEVSLGGAPKRTMHARVATPEERARRTTPRRRCGAAWTRTPGRGTATRSTSRGGR